MAAVAGPPMSLFDGVGSQPLEQSATVASGEGSDPLTGPVQRAQHRPG